MAEELLTVVDENDAPLRSDTRAALHRGDGVLHRAQRPDAYNPWLCLAWHRLRADHWPQIVRLCAM